VLSLLPVTPCSHGVLVAALYLSSDEVRSRVRSPWASAYSYYTEERIVDRRTGRTDRIPCGLDDDEKLSGFERAMQQQHAAQNVGRPRRHCARWQLDQSVWRPRKDRGNSRDYFETAEALRKMYDATAHTVHACPRHSVVRRTMPPLTQCTHAHAIQCTLLTDDSCTVCAARYDVDWSLLVRARSAAIPKMIARYAAEAGQEGDTEGYRDEEENVRERLASHRRMLYSAFDYYACTDVPSAAAAAMHECNLHSLSFDAYMALCSECVLALSPHPLCLGQMMLLCGTALRASAL
jgi:hypothetical protein